MNTDFRVSASAVSHPKILKLMRRCGDVAFFNLIKLWTFTAQNKPSGVLGGMNADDVEIAAGWNGEPGTFVTAIVELRLIDQTDDGYVIHDWEEHNGYASYAEQRTEKARNAANKRWKNKFGINEHMLNDARSNAPSPSPSPSPALIAKNEDSSLRSESSCPEPPAEASGPQPEQKPEPEIIDQPEPAIMTFPLAKRGETFLVTQPDIGEWQETFPGVDVLQELRHCLQWSRDNPTRRKTRNGIRKHITAWLAKAQNRSRGQPAAKAPQTTAEGYPVPRTVRDAITIQQDMEAKRLLGKKLRQRGVADGNGNAGGGTGRGDDAQHQIGQGLVERQHLLAGPRIH